jgi:hypothetical protein
MAELLLLNREAFVEEVTRNRKTVYLNFLFWIQVDCVTLGTDQRRRLELVRAIRQAWESNLSAIALPS